MLLLEFIVIGKPKSHQTRNRRKLQEWKQLVRQSALLTWPADRQPVTDELKITVQYFHQRISSQIDGDNLLKPIQDALIGLAYEDDRQIIDTATYMRNIDGAFRLLGMPRTLIDGFLNGEDFVYIRLELVTDKTRIW
jgi:Holliday junction resolvase RusA-like endonuclease